MTLLIHRTPLHRTTRARPLSLINAAGPSGSIGSRSVAPPRVLRDGPNTARRMAQIAHCHPQSLLRLQRLTSLGELMKHRRGVRAHAFGRAAALDVPGSLAGWGTVRHAILTTWGRLVEAFAPRKRPKVKRVVLRLPLSRQRSGRCAHVQSRDGRPDGRWPCRSLRLSISGMRPSSTSARYGELIYDFAEHLSCAGPVRSQRDPCGGATCRLAAERCRLSLAASSTLFRNADAYLPKSVLHVGTTIARWRFCSCRRAMAPCQALRHRAHGARTLFSLAA
jgi:hypothetical protein